MLREQGAQFLSDDMTLLDTLGTATCFPPLTISHHTLRAVQAGDLTHAEWRKRACRAGAQEGRDLAMLLARLNIPIMGFNSMTQRIIPPPNTWSTAWWNARSLAVLGQNLFIIERGELSLSEIGQDAALETL
jgi:hypothetical protein